MADPTGRTILRINFGDIDDRPLALTGATKYRFRFLDGAALAHKATIHVLEFEQLPAEPYAVISYVWRGLPARPGAEPALPNIHVEGAEGADPISVDVLRLIALAAEKCGSRLIWLDALCILQAHEDDKAWQIQRMYDLYRNCKTCIVAPGGLRRLVAPDEETTWMTRAWTLQEAIAPPEVHCIFSWSLGNCMMQSNFPLRIEEVERGVAAVAPLGSTLATALKGTGFKMLDWSGESIQKPSPDFQIRMFGDRLRGYPQMRELVDAIDMKGKRGMYTAIWRSSFMRMAKYPVDSVYSIMGIMGVTLDATRFGHDDRLEATIALMQALLARGEHAEWLAIATKVVPNPRLSTLPAFPQTDASRKPILESREGMKDVADVMDTGWRVTDTPKGTMSDDGYFRFSALSASVRLSQNQEQESAASADEFGSDAGENWEVMMPLSSDGGSHKAVFVGRWEQYSNGAFGLMRNPRDHALMLIEEHVPGRFRNVGYAFVPEGVVKTGNWKEGVFEVGGCE